MGLDEFTTSSSTSSNNSKDESDTTEDTEEPSDEDGFPSKEHIATVLNYRASTTNVGVEVKDGQLTGSADDFAMLFALMFLDIDEADPYNLTEDK